MLSNFNIVMNGADLKKYTFSFLNIVWNNIVILFYSMWSFSTINHIKNSWLCVIVDAAWLLPQTENLYHTIHIENLSALDGPL